MNKTVNESIIQVHRSGIHHASSLSMQVYIGENMLLFDEMMISYLRQMLTLTFSVYTLLQQFTRASLSRRKNFLTGKTNQSLILLLNSLAQKQQIPTFSCLCALTIF